MARPTKHKHEKRTAQLPPIRVTEAEFIYVQRQAYSADMTLTHYLRSLALTGEVIHRSTKLEESFLVELNRIGVNINQVATIFNAGRNDVHILHSSLLELRALMEKIEEQLL